jgi:hypothetical protein
LFTNTADRNIDLRYAVFKHSVYLIGKYLYSMFSYGGLGKTYRVYKVFINKYRETRSF